MSRAMGGVHPDTVIADALTAMLNGDSEPSGADVVARLSELIVGSGRPLPEPVVAITTDVTWDCYGLARATVRAGDTVVVVRQLTDGSADIGLRVTSAAGVRIRVVMDDHVLGAVTDRVYLRDPS